VEVYLHSFFDLGTKWRKSWDNSSIVTCYRLDDRGWIPGRRREKAFLFTTASKPVLGPTQPPIQAVPRAYSPDVTRPGRETAHLHLASRLWMSGDTPPLPH